MPRLGGKKLYHLLGSDLRQMGSIGRDKFFGILRDNDLLVVPKRSYTRTTLTIDFTNGRIWCETCR